MADNYVVVPTRLSSSAHGIENKVVKTPQFTPNKEMTRIFSTYLSGIGSQMFAVALLESPYAVTIFCVINYSRNFLR